MHVRFRIASISLLAYLGALAGCGDDVPRQQDGGTGGSVGGSNAGSGGDTGTGGTGGDTGGSGGGTAGTGGSVGGSTAGTGGGGTGGGTAGTGGSGTAGRGGTGGGGTGGTAGTGGRGGTGGGGTGGGGTGGGGTGGGGTGGTAGRGGTGGGGTGGGGTGGGGTGGGGTGGGVGGGGTSGGTGGTGGAPACYTVAFTAPTNGATLTVNDDTNMTCADGFQYTVRITTNAPAGTMVQLFNNGNTLLGTATVASGGASFAVQLASSGQSALSIQFPSTAMCTDPSTQSTVTVNCPATAPTCNISQPTISGTHPALNGVLAPAGDRASQSGSPYQVTFVVTTNAEDGQPVTLAFNNAASPGVVTTLNGAASGGSVTFGLTLVPDGTYQVIATCRNVAGVNGSSGLTSFPVDTAAPDLTVTGPMGGQFLGPTDLDSLGRFSVCGQTTSADAANLPASLGAGVNNLCVALGGSATCVGTAPVTAINTDACVKVTCPGGAPFNLTVTLKDAAGNPTATTLQAVSCASMLPSVQVITPVSDAPTFTDKSKHILAANAPVGIPDQSPGTPGAQTDVVACTDRAGSATLLVGLSGVGSLNPLGSPITAVAAVPADNCPAGLGFVARFSGVTLPESTENTGGTIARPTELRVSVVDPINPANIGTSVPVDVWVDTNPPVLTLRTPANLCGSFQQSSTTVTQDVTFNAENASVIMQVTNNGVTDTHAIPAFASGVATFSAIPFDPGQNDVTATETDPAGNLTTLAPVPCSVTIGSAPVVTFTTPAGGSILCPIGSSTPGCIQDGDGTMAGWQGTIAVHVTANGQPVTSGNVTFTIGTTMLGAGPIALDVNGNAVLGNSITLPEGTVTIVATTDNIAGSGVGTGSTTVTVDLGLPDAPTNLVAVVSDRRKTSIQLTWTAPGDNGVAVSGYDIRYASTQITDDTSFNAGTPVIYTGNPAQPNAMDGRLADDLYIENGYFFAVKARDAAGNLSPFIATNTAVTAHFNVTTLAGTSGLANEQFGFQLDGSGDVNRDGHSDILVGSTAGQHAYLFFGTLGGFSPTTPSVVFSGDGTTVSFGRGVAAIGDVDDDTREDIAISDTSASPPRIFIYKGRAAWPTTMGPANADYVITGDSTYNGSSLGGSLARLGDFNGDGADDFAIGASGFTIGSFGVGRVVVILGKSGFANITLPDVVNAITIDGDSSLVFPLFGSRVIGLGHFGVTGGTMLVASAPGAAGTSSSNGRLYAFQGQAGSPGSISLSSAQLLVGPVAGADIGGVLSNLGPIVNSLPSLGSGNPSDLASTPGVSGSSYVLSGTAAAGPFANRVVLNRAGAAKNGQVIVGGGISGRDFSYSLLGDARPDLVLVPQTATSFHIVDGNVVAGLGVGPTDSTTVSTATITLPSGWGNTGQGEGQLIPDVNGDNYADFAIGNAINPVPGTIAVYW